MVLMLRVGAKVIFASGGPFWLTGLICHVDDSQFCSVYNEAMNETYHLDKDALFVFDERNGRYISGSGEVANYNTSNNGMSTVDSDKMSVDSLDHIQHDQLQQSNDAVEDDNRGDMVIVGHDDVVESAEHIKAPTNEKNKTSQSDVDSCGFVADIVPNRNNSAHLREHNTPLTPSEIQRLDEMKEHAVGTWNECAPGVVEEIYNSYSAQPDFLRQLDLPLLKTLITRFMYSQHMIAGNANYGVGETAGNYDLWTSTEVQERQRQHEHCEQQQHHHQQCYASEGERAIAESEQALREQEFASAHSTYDGIAAPSNEAAPQSPRATDGPLSIISQIKSAAVAAAEQQPVGQSVEQLPPPALNTAQKSEVPLVSGLNSLPPERRLSLKLLCDKLANSNQYTRPEISAIIKSLDTETLRTLDTQTLRSYLDSKREQDAREASEEAVRRTPPRMVTLICPELNTTVEANLNALLSSTQYTNNVLNQFKLRVYTATKFDIRLEDTNGARDEQKGAFSNKSITDDVVLSRVDSDGWSVEISDDFHSLPAESVHYNHLDAGDCIEVRRFGVAFISGKYRLDSISASEKYNKELRDKVEQLKQDYTGYRRIRGDGNCYYRSVIFGLLEFIIVTGKRGLFKNIYDYFKDIVFVEQADGDEHKQLLQFLHEAADGNRWPDVASLQCDLLTESTGLDHALIRACKQMVVSEIKSKEFVLYNGMSVGDAIIMTYEDVTSVADFCEKYVLAMDVCAEGIHVNLGLLPTALGCNCNIVILPRDRNQRISTVESRCGGEEGDTALERNLCTLHLLLRPGHYDLLYTEDVSGKLPERLVADVPEPLMPGSAMEMTAEASIVAEVAALSTEQLPSPHSRALSRQSSDNSAPFSAGVMQSPLPVSRQNSSSADAKVPLSPVAAAHQIPAAETVRAVYNVPSDDADVALAKELQEEEERELQRRSLPQDHNIQHQHHQQYHLGEHAVQCTTENGSPMDEIEQIASALDCSYDKARNYLSHYGSVTKTIENCVRDSVPQPQAKAHQPHSHVQANPPQPQRVTRSASGALPGNHNKQGKWSFTERDIREVQETLNISEHEASELLVRYSSVAEAVNGYFSALDQTVHQLQPQPVSPPKPVTVARAQSDSVAPGYQPVVGVDVAVNSDVETIVNILSVTPDVASRVLSKFGPNVEEAIGRYMGCSDREKAALIDPPPPEPQPTVLGQMMQTVGNIGQVLFGDDNTFYESPNERTFTHVTAAHANPAYSPQYRQNNSGGGGGGGCGGVASKNRFNAIDSDDDEHNGKGESIVLCDMQLAAQRRALDEQRLAALQVKHVVLRRPEIVHLVWLLLDYGQFDMQTVTNTIIENNCGNMFAFIHIIRSQAVGYHLKISVDDVIKLKPKLDAVLVKLLRATLQSQQNRFDRLEVWDAIAFDYCRTVADVTASLHACSDLPNHRQSTRVFLKSIEPYPTNVFTVQVYKVSDTGVLGFNRKKLSIPHPDIVKTLGRAAVIEASQSFGLMTPEWERASTMELKVRLHQHLDTEYEEIAK